MSLLAVAIEATHLGLSVVPPREDGSKAPAVKWETYQERRADEEELRHWYANGTVRHGLGLVCGRISGNLEMLEFEARAVEAGLWADFKAAVDQAGLHELLTRIQWGYGERTPAGGFHLLYRCEEMVDGNTKLAQRKGPDGKPEVLIETRGEGGYVVVAPSSGPVHPSGKPWELLSGSFSSIATVSPEERNALFALARSFNELELPNWSPAQSGRDAPGRPGDDFNERGSWARDILEPAGWTYTGLRGGRQHWYRNQGGRTGWTSATISPDGQCLYVFSSSTELPTEVGIAKFGAFALLHHGGKFAEAAAELRKRGYGSSTGEIRRPGETPEDIKTPPSPWLTPLGNLLIQPPQPRDWLIEGLLIRGGVGVFGAKPKVGKTTLLHQLALAVSRGEKFLDRSTKQGPVIYLALEEDEAEVIARFRILGAKPDDVVYVRIGQAGPDGLKKLAEAITETGGALALIDPIQRLTRLDDINDYSEVSNATDPLIALARISRCAIAFSHHLGKLDREGGDQLLGSTALFATVDTSVILRKTEDGTRTLETLQRYGKSLDPVVLGFNETTGAAWIERTAEAHERDRAQKAVLTFLSEQAGPVGQKTILEGSGLRWNEALNAINALQKTHQIETIGGGRRGNPFQYQARQIARVGQRISDSLPGLPYSGNESGNESEGNLVSLPDENSISVFNGFIAPIGGGNETLGVQEVGKESPQTGPGCSSCGSPAYSLRGNKRRCHKCGELY